MRRFKDFILKDKKFLREIVIILIVGIIINVACFFLCFITGYAANENPNDAFPYQIGIPSNVPIPSEIVNQAIDNYISILKTQYGYDPSNGALCFLASSDGVLYYLVCCDELTFDISGYPNTFVYNATHQHFVQFTYNSTTGVLNQGSFYGGYVASWTFSASSLAINSHGYILNSVPNEFNASYGSSTITVWSKNGGNVSDLIGEFTDLPSIDEILNNIQNTWEPPSSLTGHALPSAPTENPNNNDFQNRLQMFDYLKDSINSIVGNLGYNLKNWIDNLTGKMVEGFNSVSQNLWNGFKTLMDNIKDFFGPKIDAIIEKFNYITEEPDSEEIIDFIETTSIYSDISSINTSVSTFGSSFTGVSEPDDYTIIFHIEDIDILNQSDPFVLHLNILNPIKSTLRAFLWVIVSYGLFISVIDSLPNYINGGGGEDD